MGSSRKYPRRASVIAASVIIACLLAPPGAGFADSPSLNCENAFRSQIPPELQTELQGIAALENASVVKSGSTCDMILTFQNLPPMSPDQLRNDPEVQKALEELDAVAAFVGDEGIKLVLERAGLPVNLTFFNTCLVSPALAAQIPDCASLFSYFGAPRSG